MKLSQCSSCRNLDRGRVPYARVCPAFPNGIPAKVYFTETYHDRVLPGQTGDTVYAVLPGYEDIAVTRPRRPGG